MRVECRSAEVDLMQCRIETGDVGRSRRRGAEKIG